MNAEQLAAEVYEHRMLDTYAGYDWGDPVRLWTIHRAEIEADLAPKPAPVTSIRRRWNRDDLVEELAWFRECGVHPALTLQQLGVSMHAASQACVRAGVRDLGVWVRSAENKHGHLREHEFDARTRAGRRTA